MLLSILLILSTSSIADEPASDLIQRLLPDHADQFIVETITSPSTNELFEIESVEGKVALRGTSDAAIASALNWYLKYSCNAHVSWCGNNLDLPDNLPTVADKIHRESPYTYRYYFNYCTHSYTMAFWDWERWEKEIDWMALNGINMPLAITGQAAVWREVYRDMGLSDLELAAFFTGPAYFGWGWMGNIDGWGGPLPSSWIDSHAELQKKILARQRALGMKPILPAFSGHVPPALQKHFPNAKISKLKGWGGFQGTYVLDPLDPLFNKIGKAFILKQTEIYGTDHLYSADTFNEMDPASGDLKYLADVSKSVFRSMTEGDPKAVNVMQAWLFLHENFWTQDRIKAYLDGVPNDRLILLDLFASAKPQWKRTEAFHGKPWIWCMLNNWGGKMGMYGRSHAVANELPTLKDAPEAGQLVGIGLSPEGLQTNPFIYDLMTEMTWRNEPVNVRDWTRSYIRRRYGKTSLKAETAWDILATTLYDCRNKRHGPQGAHYCMRPTPNFSGGSFVRSELFYEPEKIREALKLMLEASTELGESDAFQYDLVDLTRQCMSDLSLELHHELDKAYKAGNAAELKLVGDRWLEAILDLDRLLATRPEFLLGNWLEPAKKWATTPEERLLYEWNSRNLITLWGDKHSPLHDYAQKQWSGLMKDFYYPRWEAMLTQVTSDLKAGKSFDQRSFNANIATWEEQWTKQTNTYPTKPTGNPVTEAQIIYRKYLSK